jgi:hypothetical protein
MRCAGRGQATRATQTAQQFRQGRATRAALLAERNAASDADSAARHAEATPRAAREGLDRALGAPR